MDLVALLSTDLGVAGRDRFFPELPQKAEHRRSTDYLEPKVLRSAIIRGTGGNSLSDSDFDLRPAASRWTRQYAASLWPAVLVALAHGVGLDAGIERCTLVMRGHLPGGIHLDSYPEHTLAPAPPQELRAHVFERVMTHHLIPLYSAVENLVKISPDLMWSNAAEHADLVCEAGQARLTNETARVYAELSRAILESDEIPGVPGPNLLKGWIGRDPVDEPDFPRPLQLRHVCCVHYLLPDRVGRFCSNCPLISSEERVAMARSARGGHSLAPVSRVDRAPAQSQTDVYIQPGETAPPFTLPSTNGSAVSLDDMRARKSVLLLFYTRDDLPASVAEFMAFARQYRAFAERDIEIVGISPDSLEDHHRFRDRYQLPFHLLSDVDHVVSSAYGSWQTTDFRGKPVDCNVHTTYLIDPDGVVRALYTHVRGELHAEQVLAALPQLLGPTSKVTP